MPPKEQREFRDLMRYRNKLNQHEASENNQMIIRRRITATPPPKKGFNGNP